MTGMTRIGSVVRQGAVVLAMAALVACGGDDGPTAPTPTPTDPNAPVAGRRTGPVLIEYVGASVAPGSTIAGCGPTIAGCAGRLRLSFRLRSASAGPVLGISATLHGANRVACLTARAAGFQLGANATVTLELVFDEVNPACALPFDSLDMGVTIEGTVEVASRQEFGIRYRFTP
jgi:hypothetical protein